MSEYNLFNHTAILSKATRAVKKVKQPKTTGMSCPLLEELKRRLIVDMFTTGRIDGKYFGVVSRSDKNGIKEYIKACLFKQRLGLNSQLIDDCYNELFYHLQKMSSVKILGLYNESPKKLLATCLRIIALKCFAKDNRLNRPNHSLIESVRFASVLERDNTYLQTTEYVQNNDDADGYNAKVILIDEHGTPEPFEKKYGFTVEDMLACMSVADQATFYSILKPQRRGKAPGWLVEERQSLFDRILSHKAALQAQ